MGLRQNFFLLDYSFFFVLISVSWYSVIASLHLMKYSVLLLQPPSTPRGEIVRYTIQYRVKGEDDYTTISTPSNATKYTITDLKQFEE